MVIDDIDFSSLPIWIPVHDLPVEYMSKENAEEIGALIGDVIDVDFTSNDGICLSKYLRIKVELKEDVRPTRLMKRGLKNGQKNHVKGWKARDLTYQTLEIRLFMSLQNHYA
ncbi:hypothetical protein CFP56_003435 [Quercus suber]|uniref:DUF4283 domain-containing protein n=1 Tax=Quercus suber TaxID=58331 RepID=A0AAW0LFF9_QUESU